jgi:hypothetical protein
MLTDALLAALLLLLLIMTFDHRKWRKAMSAGFVETTINSTDLFSQATDHLAFIADCMDEQAANGPAPAVEGMPQFDLRSLLTQAFISKMTMPPPDSDGSTKEIRQVHEEESDTQTEEAEV